LKSLLQVDSHSPMLFSSLFSSAVRTQLEKNLKKNKKAIRHEADLQE